MQTQEQQPGLPFRSHNILGVCEGIGEDFGFNPIWLRVPFAASVLFSPMIAIGAYFGLGVVVLASRLLFPKAKAAKAVEAEVTSQAVPANDPARQDLSIAA